MPETRNNRKDILAKVMGKAKYTNDMKLPGMVHAAVVRSSIPCGDIVSINTAEAAKAPGVLAVYTGKDVPGLANLPQERPVLCQGRVRYIGDAVALVVAETRQKAAEATALVRVEYKELPALLDAREALAADAPRVHGDTKDNNEIVTYVARRGDVEAALEAAPHILHRQYETQRVQHVCLETEAAIADYDAEAGEMNVFCPVNSPFVIRKTVAETLGFAQSDVRVRLATIGGSFGGKNYDIAMACSRAAMVALLLRRPCKVYLTREESITEGTKRHPLYADYTVGYDDEGRLLAARIDLLLDGGAYKSKTFPVTSRMAIEATGPYYVPCVDTRSTSVFTNNVYSDALRGFGSPQVDFCSESLMDEIATELGKDPMEVRRLNMLREGGLSSIGQTMRDVTLDKCVDALEKAADIAGRKAAAEAYNAAHTDKKRGVGVAFLHRGESFGAAGQGVDVASGMLSIQPDGSAVIASSIAEVGQGAAAMMVNLVHEAMGIPRGRIRLGRVDTAYLTDAGPTVATRGTVFCGGAVLDAAEQIKQKMAGYAEKHLGTRDVLFRDYRIVDAADENNYVSFCTVVADAFAGCDHLNALGFFRAPPLAYDKASGVGEAYMSYVYGAVAADVTVDLRTGAVSCDELFAVHDVGHAFDMAEVEGQILGGVSMGVGYALYEEVELSNGRVQNLNYENYIIPTVLDMPRVTMVVLEEPGPHGPLGAKGLGEPATCAVAPAIINAIDHACGRRVRQLPANLEQIAIGKNLKRG